MTKRRALVAAAIVSASLAGASQAMALAPPADAPTTGPSTTLPDVTQPLIYFGDSRLVSELNAGTVAPSTLAASQNITFITCFVNFKRGRSNSATDSYFNWNGSVSCDGTLQMWGRAYLLQSAQNYVQYGQYYSKTGSSASSGGAITVSGHPSVYVNHSLNLRLQPSQLSDTVVGVTPAPGAPLNGASYCHPTGSSEYGSTGASCELFSDRF